MSLDQTSGIVIRNDRDFVFVTYGQFSPLSLRKRAENEQQAKAYRQKSLVAKRMSPER